jgi:uncharacterized membrane protein
VLQFEWDAEKRLYTGEAHQLRSLCVAVLVVVAAVTGGCFRDVAKKNMYRTRTQTKREIPILRDIYKDKQNILQYFPTKINHKLEIQSKIERDFY